MSSTVTPSQATSEMTRRVAERWFGALNAGNGPEALSCLDDQVVWINNPPEKGLSDIVPWLGEFHGLPAVQQTFVIWADLAQVLTFEVRGLVINGDEALAIVYEVARVKATGLNYEIEFIQRFRVANEKIVFWKSYWDTVKGIVPFRGDMSARLLTAAASGDVTAAMGVLPFGVDPNTVDKATGLTVLMIAAGRGRLPMVQTLLSYGADVNAMDRRAGTTALHKACQGGHFEVVKALVEAGAFIDIQAPSTGHTPLVEAIWFKSDQIVEYLLERGARIELKTYYGFTIDQHIDYALRVNQGRRGIEALQRIRQLVNQRRESDERKVAGQALNRAALAGDLPTIRRAIKEGANLEERYPIIGSFSDGHTPLLIAARDGHTEIVRELIDAGADVNATEPIFGAVPLHKATYNGYAEITRLLARAPNVDLNFQGASNGYTPLQDALWHGFDRCAEELIEAGAELDVVAFDGKTAEELAVAELGEAAPVVGKLRDRLARK